MMFNPKQLVFSCMLLWALTVGGWASDIFTAAEQGDLESVKALLEANPQLIDAVDDAGYTAVHEAAYNGHTAVLEYLISRGGDINARSNSGSTPLHGAAFHGRLESARLLIESGADIEALNRGGFTPLLGACAGGRTELVKLLIAHGADINAAGGSGWTALMHAVNSRNRDIAELLLERGVDVNAAAAGGQTALYRAVWNADLPNVELLIARGAEVNVPTEMGVSLPYFAVAYRSSDISNLLIEKAADVMEVNELQLTMLHYAAALGLDDQVNKLIAMGADIDAACINSKTPLYYASLWGHDAVIRSLIEHGADGAAGGGDPLTDEYLGMTPPGRTPEVFAENVLLTPFAPHGKLAFSPDGTEMFWCHHAMPIQAMWYMTRHDGVWQRPMIAPFTDPALDHADGSPSFSPDGQRVLYHSNRPVSAGGRKEDSDIWYVEKTTGGWGAPVNMGAPINSDKSEYSPAIAANGNIYFIGEDYDDSYGTGDIYLSELIDGVYAAPGNLGDAVNSAYHEISPAVARDESYIIFASDRPHVFGQGMKLFVAFKKEDGGWSDAVTLGRTINAEFCWQPSITPDQKYIIYLRRNNYYWFSTQVIEDIKTAVCEPGRAATFGLDVPSFRKSDQVFEHAATNRIALGDLDGDGDLDAVFSNMRFNDSRVYLNDGTGTFAATDQRLTQQGHGVDLGDLDGDGDLDIFMTCADFGVDNVWHHRPSKIYFNDGTAGFTASDQDLGDSLLSGNAVWLYDIDGDDELDAMVVYYEEANGIYLNDGRGGFTRSDQTFPDMSSWGDLDGDGDTDILAREIGLGFTTLLNDGSGRFTEHWRKPDSAVVRGGICLVDLDGDTDLDAVVTSGGNAEGNPSTVWYNDGTGRFTDSDIVLPVTRWGHTATGDVNDDGHPDIFVTNFGYPSAVWLNDGDGRLRDAGLRLKGVNYNGACSLGDLDNDGDLDVFIAAFGDGPNEIWFNEHR